MMIRKWNASQAKSGIVYDYQSGEFHNGEYCELEQWGRYTLGVIALNSGLDVSVLIYGDKAWTTDDWQGTRPESMEDAMFYQWVSWRGRKNDPLRKFKHRGA